MKDTVIRATELVLGRESNDGNDFAVRVPDVPTDYQQDLMDDDSQYKVFVSGRQAGKTTLVSWEALDYALSESDTEVIIYNPSQLMSRSAADTVRSQIDRAGGQDAVGVVRNTRTRITFENGSQIRFERLNNGIDTHRNADAVLVDGAAYVNDSVSLADIEGVAGVTGDVSVFSTPQETEGAFYRAACSEKYSSHHAKSIDNPRISSEDLSRFSEPMDDDTYQNEVMGRFNEGGY